MAVKKSSEFLSGLIRSKAGLPAAVPLVCPEGAAGSRNAVGLGSGDETTASPKCRVGFKAD